MNAMKEKEESGKRKVKKNEKEEKKQAAALDGLEVVVQAKSDGGKLFAAIGPKAVMAALKELGYKVDEEQIEMTPMKDVGTGEAVINFDSGYEATISIVVEA